MAENTQNPNGMPNPNDDSANRQPQQSGGSGQQGGDFAADRQSQQFDSSAGQSGGASGSDTNLTDQVREHMNVIGPDGATVGKVDSVDGGRIKLTRHDSADGQHHYLDASHIEGIEGDQIRLIRTPDWTGDSGESSRAM